MNPVLTIRRGPLLRATENDRYFDYCLQPYEPRQPPTGKLRGENLLWHSFEVAGAPSQLFSAVQAIQQSCGRDMTVFGVKLREGRLFWELYFYDPQKEDHAVTLEGVARTLEPFAELDARMREQIPYFMFSFELDDRLWRADRGRVDGASVYLAAHRAQAGRSYRLSGERMELENFYQFYRPGADVDEILHQLRSSVFVEYDKVPLQQVLIPELFACRRVCVAKKRLADGIYYSGINVEQLLWFLRRFAYPPAILEFVVQHQRDLDHLLFDVGIDLCGGADGRLVTAKTSYYGTL